MSCSAVELDSVREVLKKERGNFGIFCMSGQASACPLLFMVAAVQQFLPAVPCAWYCLAVLSGNPLRLRWPRENRPVFRRHAFMAAGHGVFPGAGRSASSPAGFGAGASLQEREGGSSGRRQNMVVRNIISAAKVLKTLLIIILRQAHGQTVIKNCPPAGRGYRMESEEKYRIRERKIHLETDGLIDCRSFL